MVCRVFVVAQAAVSPMPELADAVGDVRIQLRSLTLSACCLLALSSAHHPKLTPHIPHCVVSLSSQQVQYSSSVDIRPEWAVKEQIPFQSLQKLTCSVGQPKDLYQAGELEYYDK